MKNKKGTRFLLGAHTWRSRFCSVGPSEPLSGLFSIWALGGEVSRTGRTVGKQRPRQSCHRGPLILTDVNGTSGHTLPNGEDRHRPLESVKLQPGNSQSDTVYEVSLLTTRDQCSCSPPAPKAGELGASPSS